MNHSLFGIFLPENPLWVFAYASLMWDPGFAHVDEQTARLYGYNRRLCQWSFRYRGYSEKPGLVAGLAPGGSCTGKAFRIDPAFKTETLEYLHEREMISDAYHPVLKSVHLEDGRKVKALTFVSNRTHEQYAPPRPTSEIARIVSGASGLRGENKDYVFNTVKHLDELGITESELHEVARILKSRE